MRPSQVEQENEKLSLSSRIYRYPVFDDAARGALARDLTLLINTVLPLSSSEKVTRIQTPLITAVSHLETTYAAKTPSWVHYIQNSVDGVVAFLGAVSMGVEHVYDDESLERLISKFYWESYSRGVALADKEKSEFVLDLSDSDYILSEFGSRFTGLIKTPVKRLESLEVNYGATVVKLYNRVGSRLRQSGRMDLNEKEKSFFSELDRSLRGISYYADVSGYKQEIENRLDLIQNQAEEFYKQKSKETLALMRTQTVSLRNRIAAHPVS